MLWALYYGDDMPVKIKFILAAMKEAMPKARKIFNEGTLSKLGDELNRQIKGGQSPVKGIGRYQDYSDSYKGAIDSSGGIMRGTDGKLSSGKRKRPVNLFVSGAMQESQRLKETEGGKVKVSYGSKFAGYHNSGNANLPRRPLLPSQDGEDFSRTISKFLFDIAKKAISIVTKK